MTAHQSLRVVMVTERYYPIWGGAENQLRQILLRLQSQGVMLEIVTRRWHRDLASFEFVDGIPVNRVGFPGFGRLATSFFSVVLALQLFRMADRNTVFHSHGAAALGALTTLSVKPKRSHSIVKIATAGRITRLMASSPGRIVLWFFSRSDRVVSISKEITAELQQAGYPPQRIVEIANGVDCDRFRPKTDADRINWRRTHGFPDTSILVVFSGRLVKRKGVAVLLAAWKDVELQTHDAQLLIMGSGGNQPDSVESELKAFVIDNGLKSVTFLGNVAEPTEVLGVADVFAFPSFKEGLPNALLEAMASGLAPVVTDIGGNDQLVVNGQSGLVVPPGDSGALSQALMSLLSDRVSILRYAKAAQYVALQRYPIGITVEQLSALYQELAFHD